MFFSFCFCHFGIKPLWSVNVAFTTIYKQYYVVKLFTEILLWQKIKYTIHSKEKKKIYKNKLLKIIIQMKKIEIENVFHNIYINTIYLIQDKKLSKEFSPS